jgi:hypothetical protein
LYVPALAIDDAPRDTKVVEGIDASVTASMKALVDVTVDEMQNFASTDSAMCPPPPDADELLGSGVGGQAAERCPRPNPWRRH